MAKRHPALVPVARDHHECLILARRLAQGTAASADSWPAEPASQARLVTDFFRHHLERHFVVEEQVIFPAARAMGPEAGALVSRLVNEHRHMAQRVHAMGPGATVTAADLVAFGTLLNAHIRLEDRTLFPLMEAGLAPESLLQLQAKVAALYR